MNTKNNRRSQESTESIIRAVYGIMWEGKKPVSRITVREVCEKAQINRSTFYAHYRDVYDVAESVEKHMARMGKEKLLAGWHEGDSMRSGMESLFAFFQEYKEFYLLYLAESRAPVAIMTMIDLFQEQLEQLDPKELGYKLEGELAYHQAYMIAGISALVFKWIQDGCRETPRELYEILEREYQDNNLLFRK